jgi:large subunit ribosomal protein L18
MSDKAKRQKRAVKTRANIKRLGVVRLCVHRSLRHIEAQLIDPEGQVMVYLSSKGKEFQKNSPGSSGNVEAASQLGKLMAGSAKKLGVSKVAFDRSGFRYHGRVKALADAAREGGLIF